LRGRNGRGVCRCGRRRNSFSPCRGRRRSCAAQHLDAERDQRLKELKAAIEDPENPLDEITAGAQEREIEADYQRKLAERSR